VSSLLQGINWVDIFFLILLLEMIYKGLRAGVGGQLFSLLGYFALTIISIHGYVPMSRTVFGFVTASWAEPISFFIISAVLFVGIKIIEKIFRVISIEETATVEKLAGGGIAVLRGFLLFGVIGTFLLLVPIGPLRSGVIGSKTGMMLVGMDMKIYDRVINVVGSNDEKEITKNTLNDLKAKIDYQED